MFIGEWRKYQRPLIVVVFGFIAISFVFWGAGDPKALVDAVLNRDPLAQFTLGSVDGQPITTEEFSRVLDRVRQQRTAQGGEPPSNQQMWEEGLVWSAWDDLVNAKLVEVYAERDGFEYKRPFLVEQMKSMPDFQLPDGGFDARAWNEWVTSPRVDWPDWYDRFGRSVNLQLFGHRALASARVLESVLRERFELDNTELTLRYASVEPIVVPTEEDIVAKYELNPVAYYEPQRWKASFVRLPLEPEIASDLEAITNLANGGEPLGSLAQIYSGQPLNATSSDIGWIELNDNLPELREPLRALAVGETSAAVRSGSGYLVYKVVEERFDDVAGGEPVRSVRVEQLVIRPQLAPEERDALLVEAQEIIDAAGVAGGLEESAELFGREVTTTEMFDITTGEINGVMAADLFAFRNAFQPRYQAGDYTDVITGSLGLYVAHIEEKPERVERSVDDVRDEIIADLERDALMMPSHQEEVAAIGLEIKNAVDNLDAIQDAFPNVRVEIQELAPFTVPTFSYASGVRWNIREVAQAALEMEPGEMGGPFSDFIGASVYFVELVDKKPPTETDWAEQWPEQKEQMLLTAMNALQNQQFEDYMIYLRDRAVDELDVRKNDGLILQYLGLSQPGVVTPAPVPEAEAATESSK